MSSWRHPIEANALCLDLVPAGILVVRSDQVIVQDNAFARALAGDPDVSLVGKSASDVFSTPSRVFFQTHVFPTLVLGKAVDECSMSLNHPYVESTPVLVNFRSCEIDGQVHYVVAMVGLKVRSEIEEQLQADRQEARRSLGLSQRKAEQFESLAFTDELTGLSNRRRLHMEIDRMVRDSAPIAPKFALAMIDVNDFKRVNDVYGHHQGDATLKALADVLKGTVRSQDLAVRFGGDEFVVLLEGTQAGGARRFLRRLEQDLADLTVGESPISISYGIAEWKNKGDDIVALLKRADQEMYDYKRARQAIQAPSRDHEVH